MLAAAALLGASALSVSAGEPSAPPPADEGSNGEAAARSQRQAELDQITRDIALTEERQAELRKEIDSLDKDRATLNQHLIDTGQRVQALEGQIDKTEARISALAANEAALHDSLNQRRDVLAEVLAALQRMGRRPPPALLVRPEDALVRVLPNALDKHGLDRRVEWHGVQMRTQEDARPPRARAGVGV